MTRITFEGENGLETKAIPNEKSDRELQTFGKSNRDNVRESVADQKMRQKDESFDMVHKLTWISYFTVWVILVSQVVDVNICELEIVFVKLEDTTLGIIMTGFLAELLLLPKIILKGLFSSDA